MTLEEIIWKQRFPIEQIEKTLDIPNQIDDKVFLWALGIGYGIMLGKQEVRQ